MQNECVLVQQSLVSLFSLNVIANYLLIRWVAKPTKGETSQGDPTGHVWDGDLTELKQPNA